MHHLSKAGLIGITLQKTEVLVIGGGVMGLNCSLRLAQAGHEVTLLEKGLCGQGATTASFGALMPYNSLRQDELPELQRSSLWQYPALADELLELSGIDIEYQRVIRLQPIQSEHQHKKLSDAAKAACELWPNPLGVQLQEVISSEQAKQLEPALAPAEFGFLKCQATNKVNVVLLTAALKASCLQLGVKIQENCEVAPLTISNAEIDVVHTSAGPFQAGTVIMAAGAWSQPLLPSSIEAMVRPVKGQSLILHHDHLRLKPLLRGLGIFVIHTGDGNHIVGATTERNAGLDDAITPEAIEFLRDKACKLVPALADAKVIKQWVGFRPASCTGKPCVGFIDGVKNLYMVSGHGGLGICIAPATAKVVAQDLSQGNKYSERHGSTGNF